MTNLRVQLGPVELRTPLVAASGTVGSVVDFAPVAAFESYGAAVAKSVSGDPWPGRSTPRLGAAGAGMLNAVGIQNPGIDAWAERFGSRLSDIGVPVWGSAVGATVEEFIRVAQGLASTAVEAVEVNLSCPNIEGAMFALDPEASSQVVSGVRAAVGRMPIGAKLSPNASDIVAVAGAVTSAGADWLVLTNTVWGAAIDPHTRRAVVAGGIGGYSGPPLKPIALRCVVEVRRALPSVPIVGCGGVRTAEDVVEYLLAGANAVAIGTAHFESPRIGRRILRGLQRYCERHGVRGVGDLTGAAEW
jgi:dihydroorotate dehydrogenase (NAD+) catalytic subunit